MALGTTRGTVYGPGTYSRCKGLLQAMTGGAADDWRK